MKLNSTSFRTTTAQFASLAVNERVGVERRARGAMKEISHSYFNGICGWFCDKNNLQLITVKATSRGFQRLPTSMGMRLLLPCASARVLISIF